MLNIQCYHILAQKNTIEIAQKKKNQFENNTFHNVNFFQGFFE